MADRIEIKPKSYPSNLLQKDWTKRKCFYMNGCAEFLDKVHELQVLNDDVWLVTPPKSGTTWMQELLWLVMHDYDFEMAKSEHLELRTPFMEFDYLVYRDLGRAFKPIERLITPRLIKSHLPLPLLPQQLWIKRPKLIYVYRNPKDALISEYYHGRSVGRDMDKSPQEFLENYMQNVHKYLPFENVTEFYALRNEPWIYYTSYERMKLNLREVIEDVCMFLEKTINETQMQQMLKHLSFDEMKVNPKTNHIWEFEQVRQLKNLPYEPHNFVRKGKVNGYKDDLSPEFVKKLDNWVKQQLLPYNVTLEELLLLPTINAD